MGNRDLMIISSKASSQRRGCIAMDKNDIGLELRENVFHSLQNGNSYISQILPRTHDIEIEVRDDLEEIQDLVKHLTMLAGNAYPRLETIIVRQCQGYRGHFDSLRPRTKHTKSLLSHYRPIRQYL